VSIRLRVFPPKIRKHQTLSILHGLPEGSPGRLSPTLVGIFVANLIHELQDKFPHATVNLAPGLQHNGTTQIWIGGLLYADDLALMSTCPRELQAMLYVCQEWRVQNRMQINTHKTKLIAFFETPSHFKRPVVASTNPAQPCPPSTSSRPSQPPPFALPSLPRYSNLNT